MRAEAIAKTLGGRRVGGVWMAPCPAHKDDTPSLALRDTERGAVLVHCHGKCPQDRVIDALRSRGLWAERSQIREAPRRATAPPTRRPNYAPEDAERSARARNVWLSSVDAAGSLVGTYLRSRRITVSAPASLRFSAGLRHSSGQCWPAMVALVQRGATGESIGVHRTFLARDGSGKAPVDPAKMMLGPCRGGAVRLAEATDFLMVGEGIETCLSVMQATGKPAWAALSTSGLRALDLPAPIRRVTILADADEAGESAAQHAAARWVGEGRSVHIARPIGRKDFNDLLS